MGRLGATKLRDLEGRHPGLCRRVDAMLEAFMTLRAIASAIQTEYGERITDVSICTYKRRFWKVRRDQIKATNAARTAYEEWASEERN